jgi:hypothetical protein
MVERLGVVLGGDLVRDVATVLTDPDRELWIEREVLCTQCDGVGVEVKGDDLGLRQTCEDEGVYALLPPTSTQTVPGRTSRRRCGAISASAVPRWRCRLPVSSG